LLQLERRHQWATSSHRSLLNDSPSLRPQVMAAMVRGYPDAKREAVKETRLDDHNFPAECPFSPEQALDQDFLPD